MYYSIYFIALEHFVMPPFKVGQICIRWTAKKIVTKLFRNSDLKIPFKADSTIGKLLTHNKNINFNMYNKCGVYQLICQDCNKK